MSTQFTNRQWRLPNNENKDKQSNYSMDFSGTGDKIQTTLTPPLADNSRSISIWFYTSNSYSHNICGYGAASQVSGHNGFDILTYASNYVGIHLYGTAIICGGTYNLNSWNHYVITYDGTTLQGYLNGVAVDSNNTEVVNTLSTNDFIIGEGVYTGFNGFSGKLDGISIYDYALSSSQVTTLYGSSSTGIGNPMTLNPVAYYPLGDQDAFNGADYLVPNSSLKDYVFDFDGSNDYIDCGDSDSFSFNGVGDTDNPFSISAWINMDDATKFRITSKYNGTSQNEYIFTVGGSDQLTINLFDNNEGGLIGKKYNTALTSYQGQWIHVVCTYDATGVSSGVKLYLNRTRVDDTDNSSGSYIKMRNTSQPFLIAQQAGTYANGKMSNVQIFNTALPATGSNSVETLYNNGSPLTSMSGFTSLQGWWKLDASATYDSSTTTWTIPDDSTNSNDGTSSGMTQANLVQSDLSFTSGYSPYALDFDGTNDYINIASAGGIALMNTGVSSTVSLWVYPTGTGTRVFFEQSTPGRYIIYQSGTSLFFYPNGARASFTNLILNQWYNVIAIVDGSNSKFYVNGNEVGTSTSYTPVNTLGVLEFGRYPGGTQYFEGKLSNVSIWNTDLTSAQVTEIYNEGLPSNLNNHSAYSNLVSWWQLGSNSSFNTNWTVLDEKGSNNGTSSNMTEDAIVDGVGSYANGLSSGMGGDEVIGDAPYSSSNSLSVNMDVLDRVTDTPS